MGPFFSIIDLVISSLILVAIMVFDWKKSTIPLPLTIVLLANAIICRGFLLHDHWLRLLIGAAVGFALLLGLMFLFNWFTQKKDIGWDDVYLLTAIGANVGTYDLFRVIILASLQGVLIWLMVMLFQKIFPRQKTHAIPFGTFLALSTIEVKWALLFLIF